MSVTFSHSFGEHQHPTYLGRAGGGGAGGSLAPYGLSGSHPDDRPHHHRHHPPTASESLAGAVPFILYPSDASPLGLYDGGGGGGGFRGTSGGPHHHHHHLHNHPSLFPYLSPFHHAAAAAAAAAAVSGRFGVYECPFEPAFIQKRNERERQRVKCVNQGYAKLRQHLPGGAGDKRLSKVETLRAAIRYINYLQGLIDTGPGKGAAAAGGPKEEGEADGAAPRAGLRVETVGRDGGGESPISSALYSSLSSSNLSSPGGESQSSGC